MAKQSEFTNVIEAIVGDAARLREKAAKSPGIPPMEERVSNREARARVQTMTPQALMNMTPENRAALIKAVGTEAVVNVVRRKR